MRVDTSKLRLIGVPDDPTLCGVLEAWADAGYAALALDRGWRIVSMTAELASLVRDEVALGEFYFGPVQIGAMPRGRAGLNTIEEVRDNFSRRGGWLLADIPGGRDALREMVHPALRDLVDAVEPRDDAALSYESPTTAFGGRIGSTTMLERVRDASGQIVGTVVITKPAVGMRTLFLLAAAGDLGHFDRMQRLAAGIRRPTAILFADLEGSAQLAKRLPTASFFTLVRRLTRAADQCVIEAGGLVGRHVGDGFASFFVAETAGSESAAARACIQTARDLVAAVFKVAARHDLNTDEVTIRAGLHWGTPYIGSIITPGRTEVTALGDEVNEAARIEACATGGRALASKSLIERLVQADAAALGIDPNQITYNQLADLDTATDKARRDAPAVPVYDINITH